jgi:hypothetical protein
MAGDILAVLLVPLDLFLKIKTNQNSGDRSVAEKNIQLPNPFETLTYPP